jgi:hypothetical protein
MERGIMQRRQKERQSDRLKVRENECWGEVVLEWVEHGLWKK